MFRYIYSAKKMKKILILLLLITQQSLPHAHELKLYKKHNIFAIVTAIGIGTISLGGLYYAVFTALKEKKLYGEKIYHSAKAGILGFTSLGGCIFSCMRLNAQYDKDHGPLLIFDEEGFTYKKSMGLFQGRQYVRYLWKDVISHWVTGVVDGWGQELQKTWCYHVNGKKEIVKIDVTELDIPEELEAIVESLRMGNIHALFI